MKKVCLPLFFVLVVALSGLLSACGDKEVASAPAAQPENLQSASEASKFVENQAAQAAQAKSTPSRDRNRPTVNVPVTPVATRTASSEQATPEEAANALNTWANQMLGVSPALLDPRGINRQVLANYNILTENYGTVEAIVDASRAGYGSKLDQGGAIALGLGGGSQLAEQNISVQIQNASLGYIQLPVNSSFPTSADAALAQLKQTFPALMSYDFKPISTGNRSYAFQATDKSQVRNQTSAKAMSIVIINSKDKVWVYALVGTGQYVTKIAR